MNTSLLCLCPNDAVLQGPTIEQFVSVFEPSVEQVFDVSEPITTVRLVEVSSVIEVNTIVCPSEVITFQTSASVKLNVSPQIIPADIPALEACFVDTWNTLANQFCDPFFQKMLSAKIQDIPSYGVSVDVTFDVTMTCVGCIPSDSSQILFNTMMSFNRQQAFRRRSMPQIRKKSIVTPRHLVVGTSPICYCSKESLGNHSASYNQFEIALWASMSGSPWLGGSSLGTSCGGASSSFHAPTYFTIPPNFLAPTDAPATVLVPSHSPSEHPTTAKWPSELPTNEFPSEFPTDEFPSGLPFQVPSKLPSKVPSALLTEFPSGIPSSSEPSTSSNISLCGNNTDGACPLNYQCSSSNHQCVCAVECCSDEDCGDPSRYKCTLSHACTLLECNTTHVECCTNHDCPSAASTTANSHDVVICESNVCIRDGNPRFTLVWYGDGEC